LFFFHRNTNKSLPVIPTISTAERVHDPCKFFSIFISNFCNGYKIFVTVTNFCNGYKFFSQRFDLFIRFSRFHRPKRILEKNLCFQKVRFLFLFSFSESLPVFLKNKALYVISFPTTKKSERSCDFLSYRLAELDPRDDLTLICQMNRPYWLLIWFLRLRVDKILIKI
jgi:hypothetical protein